VTGDAPDDSFYLGRPWRPFARTVFIHCFLDTHIKPEGWHNWNKPDAEKTAWYAEYGCTGPGAGAAGRLMWSRQLTTDQAKEYARAATLGDWVR
jgi:pectinesterase